MFRACVLASLSARHFTFLALTCSAYLLVINSVSLSVLEVLIHARGSVTSSDAVNDHANANQPITETYHRNGLLAEHCHRIRALSAVRPASAIETRQSARVLLLTGSWSLPPPQQPVAAAQVASAHHIARHKEKGGAVVAHGDYAMLLSVLEANLQNPWILGVHIFVPSTVCAEQIAAEDEDADITAASSAAAIAAAVRAEAARWRNLKHARQRRGGTHSNGSRGGTGDSRPLSAVSAPPRRRLLSSLFPIGATSPAVAPIFPRVRLIVGKYGDTPVWEAPLRYAAAARSAAPFVAIARADVVWPRGFNCVSSRRMRSKGAVLALSCQAHLSTCMGLVPTASSSNSRSAIAARRSVVTDSHLEELGTMSGTVSAAAANWSLAYWSCRARPHAAGVHPTLACLPLLDNCFKYTGIQHAIFLATPPPLTALAALRALPFEFGSESIAADLLWRALPRGLVSNPCFALAPVCMRCANFPEVQAAARLRSSELLEPRQLAESIADDSRLCTDFAKRVQWRNNPPSGAEEAASTMPPPGHDVASRTANGKGSASSGVKQQHSGALDEENMPPVVLRRRRRRRLVGGPGPGTGTGTGAGIGAGTGMGAGQVQRFSDTQESL